MIRQFWDSFHEELVATSLVLIITSAGSFYLAHRFFSPPQLDAPTLSQGTPNSNPNSGAVLGDQASQAGPTPSLISPTPIPTPAVSPTPNESLAQVPFGVGGLYDYDSYKLELSNPRILIDTKTPSSRKFVIDVVLSNKNIDSGMENRITASIVKDGVIIVPQAAMSASETKIVKPGEQLTFEARISLIESTDVKELMYRPQGQPEVVHLLNP